MKVIDFYSVFNEFSNKLEDADNFNIIDVKPQYDSVFVYLTVKDCYDNNLSKDFYDMAEQFLVSHYKWSNLLSSIDKGYLIDFNVVNFVDQVNKDFYDYYVLSDNFVSVCNGFNSQLNNIVDDYDMGFAVSDDIRVNVVVDEKPFYKQGFVLEKISEYYCVQK